MMHRRLLVIVLSGVVSSGCGGSSESGEGTCGACSAAFLADGSCESGPQLRRPPPWPSLTLDKLQDFFRHPERIVCIEVTLCRAVGKERDERGFSLLRTQDRDRIAMVCAKIDPVSVVPESSAGCVRDTVAFMTRLTRIRLGSLAFSKVLDAFPEWSDMERRGAEDDSEAR